MDLLGELGYYLGVFMCAIDHPQIPGLYSLPMYVSMMVLSLSYLVPLA